MSPGVPRLLLSFHWPMNKDLIRSSLFRMAVQAFAPSGEAKNGSGLEIKDDRGVHETRPLRRTNGVCEGRYGARGHP